MAIHLSDIAASRVQHFLENRGKGIGLRLGVKTTGCSGLAYVIEFVDELQEDNEVFELFGSTPNGDETTRLSGSFAEAGDVLFFEWVP